MTDRRAVAFDLSLMSSGVCMPDRTCLTITGLGPRTDEQQRMTFLFEQFRRVLEEAGPIDAIYKEAPFLRKVGPGSIPLTMVHGVLACAVAAVCGDVPVYSCSPTALKKWATGSGTADKAQMIDAAQWRGYTGRQDDEADAFLVHCYFSELRS